ncbi:MAG TPA: protein kinase family protein [Streptosporangiaceae bacterium]
MTMPPGASGWPDGSGPGEVLGGVEGLPEDDDVLVAGRYRLAERLGVQDGSSTWRAADQVLNRPVMVWTFAPGFRRSGAVIAAARAASQLADRRLALILDADDQGDFPYVVAEWPPGRPLGELLAGGGPDEPASAAAMVAEAAEALAVAHASGLAHLCLRPSSLWRGPTGEVKISGLGVGAAIAGMESTEPALADTRGLGRLLYAALTGYWPGTEQTPLPAAPRHGDEVYSPRQVLAGIPRQLDVVTRRALADAAPPIVDPVQLADALAEAASACSPRYGRGTVRPAVAVTRAEPAPVAAAGWPDPPGRSAEPVDWTPAPQTAAAELPRVGHQPAGSLPSGQARRPRGPARQARWGHRARPAKVALAGVLALAAVAWVAAGGLSRAHHGIIDQGAGIGGAGVANPAQRSAVVARAPRSLQASSASAFNPNGQGDNNQLAPLAIDRSMTTAWQTDWYASPAFGNLEAGTGLMLDMGRVVTISGAQILLAAPRGADFQLRAGMSAGSLADVPVLASESGVGGRVRIRLSAPVQARYVVIWFTRLPADASGTFQVSVLDVRLEGWS